ncbi:MAG: patatin [Flavobacteriales bacterium]|nr:MAG: patatin [Flavobacteriales bacterium]
MRTKSQESRTENQEPRKNRKLITKFSISNFGSWLLIVSILFFSNLGFSQSTKKLEIPPNAKIGLSLSGGGAKGFAHIGTLKMIDSLGIKIDYIAGTSMGAILGGLYASGYTGKEIEKIVNETDFLSLLNNKKKREEVSFFDKSNDKYLINVPIKKGKLNFLPKSISSGQKNIYVFKDLLKDVAHQKDFSKLPIPFMCMGTNLETGKLKIFERGDLVKSIMASSAFPSLLDPVEIDNEVYVDGGIAVNFPSKQLKNKGMDIVIGVDLSQGFKKSSQLHSAIDILNQIVDFKIQDNTKKQFKFTDLLIKPPLKNYSSVSLDKKDSILLIGNLEAKKYISVLSKFPKRKKKFLKAHYNVNISNVYKIDSLTVNGNKIFDENYVQGKMNLKLPSLQTYGNINKMIDKLYSTKNYKLISYDIISKNNINYLKLNVEEDDTKFFLNFGLHYDEIYKTGLLINATIKRPILKNSTISLDVVVGDKPRYYFNYFIDNGYLPGFGISSTGTSFDTRDKEGDFKDKWTWFRNTIFTQSTWKDRYAVGFGLSHDYFKNKKLNSTNFINAYGFIKTDTRNDKNFPTKGIYFNSKTSLLDLFNENFERKIIQTNAHFSFNIPLYSYLTYRGEFYGGFTLGNNLPEYYTYKSGGIFGQDLFNFNPFAGLYFGSLESNNILSHTSEFQFRIKRNLFTTLQYSLLNDFEEVNMKNVLAIKSHTLGIEGGYNSPFGQIKLNFSHNINDSNNIVSVILGHWF